ncbi:MAG: hypothetical protein JO265_04785 [Acidimicrobiia bacterium]|nr:hypothetical protein [Acidimicrobiia bacterium]
MATPRWQRAAVGGAIVVGVVAVAVGVGVVVTRAGGSHPSSTTPLAKDGPVSANLVRAGDLGPVEGDQALRAKIEPALTALGVRHQPATTATTAASAPPLCDGVARALQPRGATLAYLATALWQGTPADVLGFSPAGAPATTAPGRRPQTRVYVLARSDCRLLVFQSFAP